MEKFINKITVAIKAAVFYVTKVAYICDKHIV